MSCSLVGIDAGRDGIALVGFLLMLFNVRLGWWWGSKRPDCQEGGRVGHSARAQELAV